MATVAQINNDWKVSLACLCLSCLGRMSLMTQLWSAVKRENYVQTWIDHVAWQKLCDIRAFLFGLSVSCICVG